MRTKKTAGALTHFYKIRNGKFCEMLNQPSETSTIFTSETGKTYHFEEFTQIGGILTRLVLWTDTIKTTNQEVECISFYLEDQDAKECLTIPFNSVLCSQILNRLLNVTKYDFKEPVFFCIGYDKIKQKSFIWLTQNEKTIPNKFTKENPGGLPPLEVKKIKGKEVYDNSSQMDFFRKEVESLYNLICE